MNKSAQFLNHGYINPHIRSAKRKLDYLKDQAKKHERANRVRTDHLTKEQHYKAEVLAQMVFRLSEFMVDCLDEFINMGIVGHGHDFHNVKAQCLELSTYLLNHAVEQGEDRFMENQRQQIQFEQFFKNIINMKLDQIEALFNFAENIKHKK